MANSSDMSVTTALVSLREKRRKIDLAIAALEALENDLETAEEIEPEPQPRARTRTRTQPYANMTLIDAAKAHLTQNGQQTTQEIADALTNGGFVTESENFRNVVSTMLHRYANDPNSGIAVAGRATWVYLEGFDE